MKKSDFTVSMPYTAYKEYEEYKKRFFELQRRLQDCFEKSTVGLAPILRFDVSKARGICAEFLPYSLKDYDIENVES